MKMFEPYIKTVHGTQDGIRWGRIIFPGRVIRRYQFDRFTGNATIYMPLRSAEGEALYDESMDARWDTLDTDPERNAMAKDALTRNIGLVG